MSLALMPLPSAIISRSRCLGQGGAAERGGIARQRWLVFQPDDDG